MDSGQTSLHAAVLIVVLATPGGVLGDDGSEPGPRLLPDPIYPCVQDVRGMKTADFDDDGVPDLVVAGQNELWSSVLISRGDGTFRSLRIPGTYSNDLAVGDFDEDGHMDVVEPTGRDLWFFRGRGDGTFDPPLPSGCQACDDYWWVTAADLDQDGHVDIVGNPYDGNVDFLLSGDGTGKFGEPVVLTEPGSYGTIGIADLDGDGRLDLVDPVPARGVTCLYFGNGGGSFRHDPQQDCLAVAATWVAGAEDLDADGDIDLAVVSLNEDQLVVLLGDGNGDFELQPAIPLSMRPYGPNLADVNGDGVLDFVSTDIASPLRVLAGRGDGGFDPEELIEPAVSWFGPLAFGDFDGDGHTDIAQALGSLVQVVRGHRDGTLTGRSRGLIDLAVGAASALAAGDLDGDGNTDLAVAQAVTPGAITLLFGDGSGAYERTDELVAGDGACVIAAAFLDADDHRDLVTGNCGSLDASILLANGGGSFAPERRVSLGLEPKAIVATDFDDDARVDLVVLGAAPDNVVRVFHGQGDGSFEPGVQRGVGDAPASMAVADLDGDATLDVVVANEASDDLSLLYGDGQGDLAEELRLAVGGAPMQVVAADLDRDSANDLVVRLGTAQDGVTILFGAGDGSFLEPQPLPVPIDLAAARPVGIAVGDLDGDRYPDLLATMFGQGVALFVGGASREFRVHGSFAGRGTPLLTDVDGDRRQDAVLLASVSLEILLNQGPATTMFEADKITLAWPPVSNAVSYNVYRGDARDLVDGDHDGLPDDGYGICITAQDDNASDNSLVDPELPAPGSGFFYLPSVVDGLGESNLGSTSAGLPRQPAAPCP